MSSLATAVTAALSAVINRADDLGQREVSRTVQNAVGIDRQRWSCVVALRAAESVLAAALHFNMKPIVACARELETACLQALRAIDAAIEATCERARVDGVRERGDFTMAEWMAHGGKPPPLLTREQWDAGERLPEGPE